MRRTLTVMLFVAGALGAGYACKEKTPGEPSDLPPVFTATLTTPNEVPAVTNGESGNGTVRITFNLTKDAAGTITGGTVDFEVTLSGFPATTVITLGHIHTGPAGQSGGILVNTGIQSGDVPLTNGAASFTRTQRQFNNIADAQRILDNPQGFYFNIHSQANPPGIVRGQLTRIQ